MTYEVKVSDDTLERNIVRAYKLIKGARRREIFAVLVAVAKFSQKELEEGTRLYNLVAGIPVDLPPPTPIPEDEAHKALLELDAWDEPNYANLHVILRRHDPNVLEYLFRGGLKPAEGLAAVLGIKTLLERFKRLQDGSDPTRQDRREQDQATLALLAELGYTAEELDRLRALVAKALTLVPPSEEELNRILTPDEEEEQQREHKVQLYLWYKQWSTLFINAGEKIPAKYLRRMGLSRRGRPERSSTQKKATSPSTSPSSPTAPTEPTEPVAPPPPTDAAPASATE